MKDLVFMLAAFLILAIVASFARGQQYPCPPQYPPIPAKGCPCPDQGPCTCKGSSCRCEEGCLCKICPANVAGLTTHPDWLVYGNGVQQNQKTGQCWHPNYGYYFLQPQPVYYQPAYQPMMFGNCAGGG